MGHGNRTVSGKRKENKDEKGKTESEKRPESACGARGWGSGGGGAGRRAKGKQEAGRGRHNLPTPVPKNVPARRVIKFTLAAEKKSLGVRLCEENQYSRASCRRAGSAGVPRGGCSGEGEAGGRKSISSLESIEIKKT